jgi:hypothetical protein
MSVMKDRLIFDHNHYVPCLRWKQGEYQALSRLGHGTKEVITPLIEVPEIGWDFETNEEAKTLDAHVEKFAKRVVEKWGERWAFVDLQLVSRDRMANGRHPVGYVFDDLAARGAFAIPVTGVGRDGAYQAEVSKVVSRDRNGACVRATLQEVSSGQFPVALVSLLRTLALRPNDAHFILDLESPSFEPLEGFTKMVIKLMSKIPAINRWRTLTICGTSFPETMGEVERGVEIRKRFEWLSYKLLCRTLAPVDRRPTFGDYAIAHPALLRVDMRRVKPAASLRYTIDDAWYIAKGRNLRDNGNEQYRDQCANLISSGLFMGERYSAGDEHIRKCAARLVDPGNLTTWRWVGTNHHLRKAVMDISSLSAS